MSAVPSLPIDLTLEPGIRLGHSHIEPEPDIPLDPVTLTVPLFPGAVPTTEQQSMPSVSYPASPYIKSAMANFELPVNRADAESWYRDAFAESSFSLQGTGNTLRHGVLQSSGICFRDAAKSGVTVTLSFQDYGQDHTLVFYLATVIRPPPREAASYLPIDIKRVDIEFRVGNANPGEQNQRRVLEDPETIKALIDTINALTDIAAGWTPGAMDSGQGAWIVFVPETGADVRVRLRPSHRLVQVGARRALIDTTGVWDVVSRLFDTSQ